jgi:hypothetical protein
MHEIKAKLMDELYEIEEKMKKAGGGKVSMSDLDYVHKLTDTIKNIDKIEMLEDGGYSEATDFMGEGRMYGTSYARRKRDSMGRYSRDGGMSYEGGSSYDDGRGGMHADRGYSREGAKADMIDKAEEMMKMASTERERQAIREFIKKLEHM